MEPDQFLLNIWLQVCMYLHTGFWTELVTIWMVFFLFNPKGTKAKEHFFLFTPTSPYQMCSGSQMSSAFCCLLFMRALREHICRCNSFLTGSWAHLVVPSIEPGWFLFQLQLRKLFSFLSLKLQTYGLQMVDSQFHHRCRLFNCCSICPCSFT